MKTKFMFHVLLLLVITSCKNNTETNEKEPKTDKEVKNNKFKVTLNLLIKKNDTLHLYFTEDKTINFKEESSIWTSVLGNDVAQEVTFELPKDVFPTELRLDLGVNKENEKIQLKGIKLDYMNKSFTINESSIYQYFRVNTDNSLFDAKTNELSRKNPEIAAGPCLYPLEIQLKTEIDKLVK